MVDGLQKDGLVDAYDNNAMGVCADLCATEYDFSREDQDNYAFNLMSVQQKLGKLVNLMRNCSCCSSTKKRRSIIISKDEI
jgi:acetyl-CoA C-acetyltransferase